MDTQERIKQTVTSNPVVLFMKGTPQFPQCGFSMNAVQILKACGVKQLHRKSSNARRLFCGFGQYRISRG